MQFIVIGASFLLKLTIFNLAYLVFLAASDFSTDLFTNDIDLPKFTYCVIVVNAVAYLFYRGFTNPPEKPPHRAHIDRSLNLITILVVIVGFTTAYFALGQKTLSLSSSVALLGIAANSRVVSLVALLVFVAGVPQAIAQDEYIPLIFCAGINVFVFLPWLLTRGRYVFYALTALALGLITSMANYYVSSRYSPFKLAERIFEQAAPMSWEGSALLWFQPRAIIGGMPDERLLLALDGVWDAQFKVTYLVVNSPIFGSVFLLGFAFLLGRFASRTLVSCQLTNTNVLKNFLKLKLLLILIEVLGEKVFDIEKIIAYTVLIAILDVMEKSWARRRATKSVLA